MAPGNKPADSRDRDVDREILRIAEIFPDNVKITGGVPFITDVLASAPDSTAGRRHAIDSMRWPSARARAAAKIRASGRYPSQERLAKELGVSVRTVRSYDRRTSG